MISRRNLTDLLVTTLATQTGYPVGDAHTPDPPYGWSGQPGDPGSTFSPYSIITPMTSSRASGPLSDTHSDWQLNYSVSSFGTSREQCEWISDKARSAFISLKNTNFDGIDSQYRIQQIRTETLGGVIRSDSVEPPLFGQTDVFSVWVAKGI